ncbi:MAG: NUDIX hydrolase [Patescibacteria group bacterium]|nr:NUDIX hydrolase [Patescibacteria group bacterium]
MQNINRPPSKQPIPNHAKKVFSGIMFDVYQWEQKLFDGTKTTFEKLKRPDTAVIFPVTDEGKIILTEQEQPGKKPFIGAAGGRIDEGEDVLEAAKRELLEETGYKASKYILWNSCQPISKIDWAVYIFIAKGIKKVSDLNLDAGEKITLKEVSIDEFIEIGTGEKFAEKEIINQLYEAKLYPKKREEVKKLFNSRSI